MAEVDEILKRVGFLTQLSDTGGAVQLQSFDTVAADERENNGGISLSLGSRGRLTPSYVPMIMTTDYQVSRGVEGKHILFWSGPANTSWTFAQRGTMQQSRTGTIAHYWRDGRRSTFFDEPSVTFTFQTGNIMPVRVSSEPNDLIFLPPGLVDYYDFFTMIDEEKILSDGRPNLINIVYHSMLYPTVLLRGFFDPSSPLTITESANTPNQVTWEGTFRIKTSDPPLHNSEKLKAAWLDAVRNGTRVPVGELL